MRFGLSVSLKEAEVMVQSHSTSAHLPPVIYDGDEQLPVIDNFCHFGNSISSDVTIDNDINSHIVKASAAFGLLSSRPLEKVMRSGSML